MSPVHVRFAAMPLAERDKVTPGMGARMAFEVVAGIIPNQPMPPFTRRWVITSDTWEHENSQSDEEFSREHPDGKSTFVKFREEAYAYAQTLTDPRSFNWVRVDWIYF